MDYIGFNITHWYLRGGDDWDCDVSLIVMDDTRTKFRVTMDKPFGILTSSREISVCRGELDFTPDLIRIKREWKPLYDWLITRYKEPERMKDIS